MPNDSADGVTVLLVAGETQARERLEIALTAEGYRVTLAACVEEALRSLRSEPIEVIVDDASLRSAAVGTDALRVYGAVRPDSPVILITGGDEENRADALRAGAFQCLQNPMDAEGVLFEVGRALEYRELVRENRILRQQIIADSQLDGLVGGSAAMAEVRKRIAVSTTSRSPVLIVGEQGTGKELVARIIHYGGPRQGQAFVPVRCRALAGGSLEFELSGHVQNAARRIAGAKRGALEEASGGTVYLEEVGATSLPVQERLVYLLEEHQVRVVGGGRPVRVDTRIIASSSRSLAELVRKGGFRQDLFSLLRVIEITLPPLRERAGDVVDLALHFLKRHEMQGGKRHILSPEALVMLHSYGWPGNIAELENALQAAVGMNLSGVLKPEDFPPNVQADFRRGARLEDFYAGIPSLANLQKRYLSYVLQCTGGNKSQAAAILGISRKGLYGMVRHAKPGPAQARKSHKT